MSGVRGKDTKIEVAVRKDLFARGYRYLVNDGRLPGKPDIVLPKHHAVVFVHGCYWHGHDCALFRLPASNREFWATKIGNNRERDHRSVLGLRALGWRVAVVWECALRGSGKLGLEEVTRQLDEWLHGAGEEITIRGS